LNYVGRPQHWVPVLAQEHILSTLCWNASYGAC